MMITRLKLKNWRNFLDADIPFSDRTYLLGANASGKSNLLDAFRFLRDVSKTQGGGLQKAVFDRGGIQKLRCLHTRRDPDVRIEVHVSESADSSPDWKYILAFKNEPRGERRTLISSEEVYNKKEECVLCRPDSRDKNDVARLTQTAIEQIQVNEKFRELAKFFGGVTYLHLVPQLLKFSDQIGGKFLEGDPFGQGFLERLARTSEDTRNKRLKRIEQALTIVVPHFQELRFIRDDVTGRPHLEARYIHYHPKAGWQREEQFSDGTLRLIALLWILQEGNSLLLLEEPELSLNNGVVAQIPLLFQRIQSSRKQRTRQIFVSTHSEALLSNRGINPKGVLLLEPAREGTKIRNVDNKEEQLLHDGFSIADVLMPEVTPATVGHR